MTPSSALSPVPHLGLLAAVLLLSATAVARPLKLSELYEMKGYVDCAAACRADFPGAQTYEAYRDREICLTGCGLAPRLWEKNGVPPVDATDLELAILEQQDAAYPERTLICYRDADKTIVVPAALCPGALCARQVACTATDCTDPPDEPLYACDTDPAGGGPRCWWNADARPARCPDVVCQGLSNAAPTAAQCLDADGDGLPAWLDAHAGLGDATADTLCNASAPCGFGETCAYDPALGAGTCAARANCGGAPCTAFHLELVAADDQEVIVHVYYDHTPVPARVLDLYLTYDRTLLTLQDGRPLPLLALHRKQLAVAHLSDGTLRLTVYGATGTDTIPNGPIVELVFRRAGDPLVATCDDGLRHDLRTDPAHCGACSTPDRPTACRQGTVCSAGRCAPACLGGTRLCGDGRCHDLRTDEVACGACGTACASGSGAWESCIAGECLPAIGFSRDEALRGASVAPFQGLWAAALASPSGGL